MAIIYDMSTGKVLNQDSASGKVARQPVPRSAYTALQPLYAVNNPQTVAACDAYMVLLQRILKDL